MRRIAYRQILIPDTVFDIERDETELLNAELRLTARTGAAYDAAGAADRLEQPNDGEPHHFPDPEAHALLRALDNLHWRSQLTNRSRMLRIREVLMGTFDTKPIPYDIRFTDAATEGDGWFSSSGPYEVGDRLSTPYGDFRIVRVEHHDEGHDVLTCAPFELDTGPQTVEVSIPPHIPPTTISNRDAGRLIDELQKIDPNATIAGRITAATQLGSSARIATLAIGEDELVLAALDRLEQTGDFLSPLQRLQRDLRKKIAAET
jgi:hypothetical protein